MRNMALCRRCGASYDIDFEPALNCHSGDDDWTLIHVNEHGDLETDLLDLTDAWHEHKFDADVRLEDVIRARTGWTRWQYEKWVTYGHHAAVNS